VGTGKQERAPIRLNRTEVESLVPGVKDYFVSVDGYDGLCLRVLPNGEKSFVLRYRFHGIQRKHVLGRYPAMLPDAAKKAHVRTWALINEDKDPNQAKIEARKAAAEARRAAVTMNDLANRYFEEHVPDLADRWQAESGRLIHKHILPAMGNLLLSAIGPADVSALLHKMRKTPTQARRTRAVLRVMLGRAEEWGLRAIGSNPVPLVKLRDKEHKRTRRLTDLELKTLGVTLRGSKEHLGLLVAVRLALLAGMRKSEILGMRWEWVDLEESLIRIPAIKTDGKGGHKTGKQTGRDRNIYLCSALVRDLRNLPHTIGSPFVFPGRIPNDKKKRNEKREPRPLENLQAPWERIRVAARLAISGEPSEEDPGLHDLRRTFASVAADIGLKGFAGELIGHAEQNVTDIYTRVAIERLKEAAETIGSRIEGILSGAIDPEKEAEERHQAKAKALAKANAKQKAG